MSIFSDTFRNGASPSSVLEEEETPIMLPFFTPITISNNEAQFMEIRKFKIEGNAKLCEVMKLPLLFSEMNFQNQQKSCCYAYINNHIDFTPCGCVIGR